VPWQISYLIHCQKGTVQGFVISHEGVYGLYFHSMKDDVAGGKWIMVIFRPFPPGMKFETAKREGIKNFNLGLFVHLAGKGSLGRLSRLHVATGKFPATLSVIDEKESSFMDT
jgi:hypothetical protein